MTDTKVDRPTERVLKQAIRDYEENIRRATASNETLKRHMEVNDKGLKEFKDAIADLQENLELLQSGENHDG